MRVGDIAIKCKLQIAFFLYSFVLCTVLYVSQPGPRHCLSLTTVIAIIHFSLPFLPHHAQPSRSLFFFSFFLKYNVFSLLQRSRFRAGLTRFASNPSRERRGVFTIFINEMAYSTTIIRGPR